MSLAQWAQAQIAQILPLDDESLRQLVEYSMKLEPQAAADHLKDILGESELTTSFTDTYKMKRVEAESRRQQQHSATPAPSEGRTQGGRKKGKSAFNRLPEVRRPEDYGDMSGAYHKKDDADDYMPGSRARVKGATGLSTEPEARQAPRAAVTAGLLGSAMPNVHTRTSSPSKTPRTSTPSPSSTPRSRSPRPPSKAGAAKVSIAGGTAMHGASTTLNDLESALRTLEMTTNPTIPAADAAARRCMCMGTRHPLLAAAPNCLSCGKVVCAKEGLAPCTFCGTPLLSPDQVQDMVRALRDERGRERQAANNASHARPDVATGGSKAYGQGGSAALEQAQAHRDRLLGFQATNAARTKVVDEAAAFETPETGVSQWSSAVQRAAQLKRQQKVLRQMEWNARPDYEKRKMVVSVDLVGGKVVRRMAQVDRAEVMGPDDDDDDDDEDDGEAGLAAHGHTEAANGSSGTFSQNPLLGKLIRPVWTSDAEHEAISTQENGNSKGKGAVESSKPGSSLWRRVQDDLDDNEEVILNGGTFGGHDADKLASEEPECG